MPDTDTGKDDAVAIGPTMAPSVPVEVPAEERGNYVRTMAKDMAALGASAPPVPQPKEKKRVPEKAPEPEPIQTETVDGVTLKKEEVPFFERLRGHKEVEPETVALPSMEEAGAVVQSEPVAPPPPQSQPVPPPAPPEPAVEAEREAVLARLREKVQARIEKPAPLPPPKLEVPVAPPAPEPPPPPPPPVPAPAPTPEPTPLPDTPFFADTKKEDIPRIPPISRDTYREPIETPPAVLPPTPPPSPAPPARLPGQPSPLQTYTGDFANRIDRQGASTFSVLAAEADAGKLPTPKPEPTPARTPRLLMGIASALLFIGIAGGGIYLAYQLILSVRSTPIAAVTVPSIVFADEYRELSGAGTQLLGALSTVSEGAIVPGNAIVTYILEPVADEEGKLFPQPVGGASFMRALALPIPDILLRNIAEDSAVGVINAGDSTHAFFALRVDSYERTYAGMLTWEPLLRRDLEVLYPLYPEETVVPVSTGTTTATSTLVATTSPTIVLESARALSRFEDDIVANRDVRVLRDTEGRSLVLYGYVDKRTLLIVRDEAAFEALIARLKGS